MSEYYGILFLILAVLQDEVKGYFGGFVCSVVAFVNMDLVDVLSRYQMNIFQSTLLIDVFCLAILSLFAFNSKVFKYLFASFFLSICVSVTMIFCSDALYYLIQPYYGKINILLFEIMVWGLFLHTTFYPKIKAHYNTHYADFVNEYNKSTKRR